MTEAPSVIYLATPKFEINSIVIGIACDTELIECTRFIREDAYNTLRDYILQFSSWEGKAMLETMEQVLDIAQQKPKLELVKEED